MHSSSRIRARLLCNSTEGFRLLFSGKSVIEGFSIENEPTDLPRGTTEILWVLGDKQRYATARVRMLTNLRHGGSALASGLALRLSALGSASLASLPFPNLHVR